MSERSPPTKSDPIFASGRAKSSTEAGMTAMSEAVVDDIVAVLPPLLQSLEALGLIARRLNPPDFGRVMHAAGTPDQVLRAELSRLAGWPEEFDHLRIPLQTSSDAAL